VGAAILHDNIRAIGADKVNYPVSRHGAFHQRSDIMHSKTQKLIIWTKKPVYRDFSSGKLGKKVGETLYLFPHQSRFDSNSMRRLPVAVDNPTTPFASVQSVVRRVVSIIHCTAVRTPLRGVIWINLIKIHSALRTVRHKKISELYIRDRVYLSVGSLVELMFPASDSKFLDGNGRIVFNCNFCDFFGNLTTAGLDKVELFVSKSLKALLRSIRPFVSLALKQSTPIRDSALPDGNVPTKVELFDNTVFERVENGYCSESGRTDINTNDISVEGAGSVKLFVDGNSNFTIEEGNCFDDPTIVKEPVESIIIAVECNRDGKGFVRSVGDLETWSRSTRCEQLEPSLVKPDGTPFKSVLNSLAFSPNIFSGFLNNVRRQKGGFTNVEVC